MKKLFIAILGITIVLSILTGGTLSYLTAKAENVQNTIAASTLILGVEPEPFLKLSGVMPGGDPQESTVNVFTNTPVKFFYKVKAGRQTGTSTKLWNALMVEIKDGVTSETWTGPLSDLETGWFARLNGVSGGGTGNGHTVKFKVWIPQAADIDDESTATVKFDFEAEQWRPVS